MATPHELVITVWPAAGRTPGGVGLSRGQFSESSIQYIIYSDCLLLPLKNSCHEYFRSQIEIDYQHQQFVDCLFLFAHRLIDCVKLLACSLRMNRTCDYTWNEIGTVNTATSASANLIDRSNVACTHAVEPKKRVYLVTFETRNTGAFSTVRNGSYDIMVKHKHERKF